MHQYIKTFKINLAAIVAMLLMVGGLALPAAPVYAAASDSTGDVKTTKEPLRNSKGEVVKDSKGNIVYQPKPDCTVAYSQLNSTNCNIVKLITVITNILSAVAGVVIALMIIVGGIQYASAGANPQAVAAARGKIKNAIIALFLFVFMYSFLQWLIPGGVFR